MRNRKTAEGDVFIATFNEKNRTVSDDHLTMIFSAVGARHGYEDVGPNSQPLKISRSDGRGPTTGFASPSPTTSTGRPTTYSVDDALFG